MARPFQDNLQRSQSLLFYIIIAAIYSNVSESSFELGCLAYQQWPLPHTMVAVNCPMWSVPLVLDTSRLGSTGRCQLPFLYWTFVSFLAPHLYLRVNLCQQEQHDRCRRLDKNDTRYGQLITFRVLLYTG